MNFPTNLFLWSTFFLSTAPMVMHAKERPNVILLLVDDMGWSDLGCYAQDDFHETPHIDRLATEGIRFTNGYASCAVSSPTRASIMTGQYPARLHITDWIPGHATGNNQVICPKMYYELPKDRITLPQALKKQGYKTLHIGKWHLGESEEYFPEHYGFDVNIGGHRLGAPGSFYYPFAKLDPNNDWTNLNLPDESTKDGDYLTDVLTKSALNEIEKAVTQKIPFFLNMSYYQVHCPIEGKPEYTNKYRDKWNNGSYQKKNFDYAAMIQSLDESVGCIIQKLEDLGIEKETFIILTSDNGGVAGGMYNGNAPLRGGKGMYYEGGIREPYIVRWPGKVKAGKESDEIVISTDIYTTILDVAGASKYGNSIQDGVSLVPYLTNKKDAIKRDAVYWHYPHFHTGKPASAIRKGDYKLIEHLLTGEVELYDLSKDISEKNNIAVVNQHKVEEMKALLYTWKKNVGAHDLIKRTPETEYLVRAGSGWAGVNNLKNPPVFHHNVSADMVAITTFSEGIVRYTLDGTDPMESSAIYTSPLSMKQGGTVKAKSWSTYLGESYESETHVQYVPLKNVTIKSFTSENSVYPVKNILDKKKNTYWQSTGGKLPESIVFDLGSQQTLQTLIYQPARREVYGVINYRTMPNNRVGAITAYRIEVGDDINTMHTVKEGTITYNKLAFLDPVSIHIDVSVYGRYVRFTGLNSIGNTSLTIENIEFIPLKNKNKK